MTDAPLNSVVYACRCPFCGAEHDVASDINNEGKTPTPGDFSLCIGCGEWSVFDPFWKGNLRKPKFDEYQEIITDKDAVAARWAWLAAKGALDR